MEEKNKRKIRMLIAISFFIPAYFMNNYIDKQEENFMYNYRRVKINRVEYMVGDKFFEINDPIQKEEILSALQNVDCIQGKGKGTADIMMSFNLYSDIRKYEFQIFKNYGAEECYIMTGNFFSLLALDVNNNLDEFHKKVMKNYNERKNDS